MKIGILSNCQGPPLAGVLKMAIPNLEIDTFIINEIHTSEVQNQTLDKLQSVDYLITQPLSQEFGTLNTSNLINQLSNILVIPNIFFRGFHPDLTYLGVRGARTKSAMGDYHSIVILYCYLSGISPEDCHTNYLDYLQEICPPSQVLKSSQTELVKRCYEIGFPGSDFMDECLLAQYSMFTINHPTSDVFIWIAKWIFAELGLVYNRDWGWVSKMFYNPLSKSCVWPVNEISAKLLGFAGDNSLVFKSDRGVSLNLKDFILDCYEIYRDKARDTLVPRRADLQLEKFGFLSN